MIPSNSVIRIRRRKCGLQPLGQNDILEGNVVEQDVERVFLALFKVQSRLLLGFLNGEFLGRAERCDG